MNKSVKIAIEIGLAVVICLLIFFTVKSVQKPVEFKKEVAARTQVAVQRLKDTHHFKADGWGNDVKRDRLYFEGFQNHCRW